MAVRGGDAARGAAAAENQRSTGVGSNCPILAPDELYASKLVAALAAPRDPSGRVAALRIGRHQRRHGRVLWSIWRAITGRPTKCCSANDKDIAGEPSAFVGMTEVDCSLEIVDRSRCTARAASD